MRILKQIYPIARKKHKCDWCGEIIEEGEKYEYSAIVQDRDFFIWKDHIYCRELTNKLDMWDNCYEEGLDDYSFQEIVNEKYIELTKDYECTIPWKHRLLIVKNEVL